MDLQKTTSAPYGNVVKTWLGCFVCMQQSEVDYEGVSVGAILSDYQRVRVEHV